MISPTTMEVTIMAVNDSVFIMALASSICCFSWEDIDDPCAEFIAELMLILSQSTRISVNTENEKIEHDLKNLK